MTLIATASIQIQKPIAEVYDGIINPDQMTKYFISESSGKMETGVDLIWKFPEFPEEFTVHSIKLEKNKSISFIWDPLTVVQINLEAQTDHSTVVKVTEDGKTFNEENLAWVIGNTGGWANFLACLKAYLEYGIHLRKGSFDFMSKIES